MNIQPIFYLEHLTDGEIAKHECSDRIWLPKTRFEQWAQQTEPGVLSVVQLTNAVEQKVTGFPFSCHYNDAPDTIYVPSWMLQRLDGDNNMIQMERISPGLCTQVTIQPYTSEHLQCDDPLEALRDAFENYSCIQEGLTIPLWIGTMLSTVTVDINVTQPSGLEPLCIRNGTLDLELLIPLNYPDTPPLEAQRPPTPIPNEPELLPMISHIPPPASSPIPPISREEMRARAVAAAMARMNARTLP
jgi:hypothetical protein